jgi:uncharacterized membrane protein
VPAKTKKTHPISTSSPLDLHRLINISDAVFAFCLTLLVLEIKIPGGLDPAQLSQYFSGLLPRLLVYLVSFLIIAITWNGHQQIMRLIVRGDGLLLFLNFVILLFVTLLPASAALLGQYPSVHISYAVMAGNGALLNLAQWALWQHAIHNRRLVDEDIPPVVIRMVSFISGISTLIYFAAVGLSFVSIPLVYILWVCAFMTTFFVPRYFLRHRQN